MPIYEDILANYIKMFQGRICIMITETCGLVKPKSDFLSDIHMKYTGKYKE